jgi:3-methylfumaryl-CoA hydratase
MKDIVSVGRFALLAALLDHQTSPWPMGKMPPLGHWLLFPPDARQSALGSDGHPARENDDLPRRMWAGSRVQFIAPVALGAELTLEVETVDRTEKVGKSGRMRFETLRKRILTNGEIAIEEEQDIVYREAVAPGVSARPLSPAEPLVAEGESYVATPAALFRFSALTFNAHRIHYDRDYAMSEEGYPGLVVHGPFLATLLMDRFLRANPRASVSGFAFRAIRPIFDGEPFTISIDGNELRIVDRSGGLAMTALVTNESPCRSTVA